MKYTNIKVAIDSESSEHKEGIEKLKSFLKKENMDFVIFDFETSYIEVTILDNNYNSEEMKRITDYCKKQGWKRGEFISNRSKNIFEAYQRAEKEFLEAKEKGTINEVATENLLHLGQFRAFLKEQIFKRTMEAYNNAEKEPTLSSLGIERKRRNSRKEENKG